MGRYNFESDITFAERQFSEARERGKKTGKEIYKENLKRKIGEQALGAIGKSVMTGINTNINNAAMRLHDQQIPQKSQYNNWNSRGEQIRGYETQRIANKMTEEEYLKQLYSGQIRTQLEKKYGPDINYNLLNGYVDSQAETLAASGVDEYKTALKASLELPTFSSQVDANGETDFDKFYKRYGSAPTNLNGVISKRVSSMFKRETDETIEFKNKKAKDNLYGTQFYSKYGDFGSAIESYDIATGRGGVLQAIVDQAKKDGKWKNTLDLKDAKIDRDITVKNGKLVTEDFLIVPEIDTETGNLLVRPQNRLNVSTEIITDKNSIVPLGNVENLTKDLRANFRNSNGELINPQVEISKILFKDGDVPTRTNYAEAFQLLAKNPLWTKPDFQDAKNKEEAFERYRNRIIQFAADDNGRPLSIESPPRSGNYVIRGGNFQKIALEQGLDNESLMKDFELYGNEVNTAHGNNSGASRLNDLKQQPINNFLKDKKKIDYINTMSSADTMFGEHVSQMVENSIAADPSKTRINLGLINFNDFDETNSSPFDIDVQLYYDLNTKQYYTNK